MLDGLLLIMAGYSIGFLVSDFLGLHFLPCAMLSCLILMYFYLKVMKGDS